jgi:hypothetical protein
MRVRPMLQAYVIYPTLASRSRKGSALLRWFFRHQQAFHIGSHAQLSCFFNSFDSLRSGRQLFGIFQRLGRPGIPVVSTDIALCEFHMIFPTAANPVRRKTNRSNWIASGRLRSSASERVHISDIRRFDGRTWITLSAFLEAASA